MAVFPCLSPRDISFAQPLFSANSFSARCATDPILWPGATVVFTLTFTHGGSAAFMAELEMARTPVEPFVLCSANAPLLVYVVSAWDEGQRKKTQ
jgi:hypothetical protein